MDETGVHSSYRWFMFFGIIGPVIAIGLVVVDILLSPWFNWRTSALSDLGVNNYSYLFNGGLVFEALANLIFIIGLRKMKLASTPVSAMLIISGLSLGLVGIFTEHHEPFHLIFALVYFILFPIGIILFCTTRGTLENSYKRTLGIITSIIGLIFIIAGILEDFGIISTYLGLGFYEFVEAVMLGIWPVYTGFVFMRK